MLDKTSEKVLKRIIELCGEEPENHVYISHEDFNDPEMTDKLITAVCYDLEENGYITGVKHITSEYDKVYLRGKYKGYAYFKRKKINAREYNKQLALSKITDVIVAFITAVITYVLMPHISAFLASLFQK